MAETSTAELRKRNLPGDGTATGGGDETKKEQVTAENSGVSPILILCLPLISLYCIVRLQLSISIFPLGQVMIVKQQH